MHCAGIDGCRGGWVGLRLEVLEGQLLSGTWHLFGSFEEVLAAWGDCAAVAVDMPIGLLSEERAVLRPCDRAARALLGRRASCVFAPPTRPMLEADSYEPLRERGLSVQAFHLLPRIRELDALMSPELQQRVWESHPELSFLALAGRPVEHSKRTPAGQAVRKAALVGAFEGLAEEIWREGQRLQREVGRSRLRTDDLLDAWALAWSALRHLAGYSTTLAPTRDERGLEMAIRF